MHLYLFIVLELTIRTIYTWRNGWQLEEMSLVLDGLYYITTINISFIYFYLFLFLFYLFLFIYFKRDFLPIDEKIVHDAESSCRWFIHNTLLRLFRTRSVFLTFCLFSVSRVIQLSTRSVCLQKHQDTARSKMYCAQDVATTICPISCLVNSNRGKRSPSFLQPHLSFSLPLFRRIRAIGLAYDYFRGLCRTLVSIIKQPVPPSVNFQVSTSKCPESSRPTPWSIFQRKLKAWPKFVFTQSCIRNNVKDSSIYDACYLPCKRRPFKWHFEWQRLSQSQSRQCRNIIKTSYVDTVMQFFLPSCSRS